MVASGISIPIVEKDEFPALDQNIGFRNCLGMSYVIKRMQPNCKSLVGK